MGQKLTYDPTPGAEPWVPYATGKATTGGSTGDTVTVEFMGRTYPGCRVLGTISAGDMVSLVVARGTSWAIELAGQIPTSIPRRLDGWGAKKPASIALRQLLDGNPRRYKYQPVRVLGAGSAAGTARCTFPDGRTSDCRAEWGGEIIDAQTDAGIALARRVGNEYRLVRGEQLYGLETFWPVRWVSRYALPFPTPTDLMWTASIQPPCYQSPVVQWTGRLWRFYSYVTTLDISGIPHGDITIDPRPFLQRLPISGFRHVLEGVVATPTLKSTGKCAAVYHVHEPDSITPVHSQMWWQYETFYALVSEHDVAVKAGDVLNFSVTYDGPVGPLVVGQLYTREFSTKRIFKI